MITSFPRPRFVTVRNSRIATCRRYLLPSRPCPGTAECPDFPLSGSYPAEPLSRHLVLPLRIELSSLVFQARVISQITKEALVGLGPQLFPCLEDSTGHLSMFRKSSSAVPRREQGQMFTLSPHLVNPRVRIQRIELCLTPWQGAVLPIYDIRVPPEGIEPS